MPAAAPKLKKQAKSRRVPSKANITGKGGFLPTAAKDIIDKTFYTADKPSTVTRNIPATSGIQAEADDDLPVTFKDYDTQLSQILQQLPASSPTVLELTHQWAVLLHKNVLDDKQKLVISTSKIEEEYRSLMKPIDAKREKGGVNGEIEALAEMATMAPKIAEAVDRREEAGRGKEELDVVYAGVVEVLARIQLETKRLQKL
ncbi:hypothetical protein IAR50_004872 [Cryptococcus sp. DSM 104548]